MPQVAPPLPHTPERLLNRIRWTKSQCRAIQEAGVLTGRYELIDGDIVPNMSQNPPHAYTITIIIAWLNALFGDLHVRGQLPISVADADPEHNDPEPDAAVTIGPAAEFAARHPGPADLHLVIEVSDTTLRADRLAKAALYARAGIREYWIMDIVGRQLFIHRLPGANGYADVVIYNEEELASTLSRPDAPVRVADLLPPAA